MVEWEKDFLQVLQSQHKNLLSFVGKIVDAFRAGAKDGLGGRINITAERYLRARLACDPYMDDDHYEQALLHLMIGLEVLLMNGEKGEGIMDKLSYRTARLTGRDDQERESVNSTMKKMYGQRSKLMHEGKLNPKNPKSIPNMQRLCEIARRALAVTIFSGDDPSGSFDKSLRSLVSSDQTQKRFLTLVSNVCQMTDAPRLTPPEK
jgi:hypothetical protein